jgi:putative sigma-54 modulation protein
MKEHYSHNSTVACTALLLLLLLQVDVHLVVNKNPRVSESDRAEVTVFAKGTVIRATESSDSMYASIDLVTDTIARKLRKYKERNVTQKRSRTSLRSVDSPSITTSNGHFCRYYLQQ